MDSHFRGETHFHWARIDSCGGCGVLKLYTYYLNKDKEQSVNQTWPPMMASQTNANEIPT
ncbi:unnamed protein product [Dovyalis caffra]|uniref:Uncharacterized protein n=1 Tax=Dovyalis caffra TaxID=77055 RepID=A0AAV1SK91_9ROSI|nr:unnamed protein product [Dovyalis caffra]